MQYLCTLHNALNIVPTDIYAVHSVPSNTSQNRGEPFRKLIFSCYGHLTILLKQGRFLSKRSNLLLKSVWTKHLAMLSSYQVHPVRGRSRKERNQSKSSRKLPRESIIWGGYSGSKVLHGRQIIFVKYIQKYIQQQEINSFVGGHWQWHCCYICCIQQQK